MLLAIAVTVVIACAFLAYMINMPGESFHGEPPPLDDAGRHMAERLKAHVLRLCKHPAGRNHIEKAALDAARDYIAGEFRTYGYQAVFQEYQLSGETYANIETELRGTKLPHDIILVGAHYDSVIGATGANDNGSGVAALLELARVLKAGNYSRTIRFVAFVNEEPPHFQADSMGSLVYAKRSADRNENIVAMFSLETIGYYSDEAGSQVYPPPLGFFYPDRGNFIAFVGNLASRPLVTEALRFFREHAEFPSEGIAAPSFIPGVSWSDHWSFWQQGYRAVMVTDTAPYRYPHYHTRRDTPDKVDYEKMTHVVRGLHKIIEEFSRQ
jgi:hypothetical protein